MIHAHAVALDKQIALLLILFLCATPSVLEISVDYIKRHNTSHKATNYRSHQKAAHPFSFASQEPYVHILKQENSVCACVNSVSV